MGFTREELESFIGATVPDLVGADTLLLFVGINPGLWTAATQTHFAHPGNRFYPALLEAGIIERVPTAKGRDGGAARRFRRCTSVGRSEPEWPQCSRDNQHPCSGLP